MYLDRILYPVTTLGPGKRIAIWTAGCNRRCEGCANPELWKTYPQQQIAPRKLAEYVEGLSKKGADGITITGGEPFDQAKELSIFLDSLESKMEVLIFTGYQWKELQENGEHQKLLQKMDVLIDGRYIEALNDGKSALLGSINQKIYYLNKEVIKKYEDYRRAGRKIQNFIYDYKTISVGIHNPPDLKCGERGKERYNA